MIFDESKLKQIQDLMIAWPNLGKLSKEAVYFLHMIESEDKMIMFGASNCYLADRYVKNPECQPIERKYVDELRNSGLISPLSQHGYGSKIGWRKMCGDIGEKFDIYLCTQ